MTTEIVDDLRRLWEIEPEWTRLVQNSPDSTPFHLPAWLLTWWEHFGSGSLHVVVVREDVHLVAVLPFFVHDWENRRQLTLVGSGISDYLDPIIDPPVTQQVMGEVQKHLDQFKGWDVGVWQDLSPDTPLQMLRGAVRESEASCSETPLTGTFEEFWQSRSKDLRRNVRRYSQRATELGNVEFEACRHPSGKLLDDLIRLHTARWHEQGELGMITANRSGEFLKSVVIEMAPSGILRFFVLRFRSDVVALIFGFLHQNKLYGYMSAFDPDYENLGFGRTLLCESIRYAYSEGIEAWNFLRGDEPYKRSWGAEPLPRCRIIVERS